MKNKTKHIIKTIEPGSIAEELELEPGDELLRVNGEIIEDVFDYHFQTNDTYLELTIRKKDGEEWDLEIEKEYDEEIGITFENEFMDQYRSCSNNCIFCFIDQMPPGMRPTLYFKDDDSRLSFLQGNYITLTNMSDHDIDRIIRYHLAPINISFQTTNPELRCKMLHNRFAGNIFPKVQRLYEAGIEMNGQIVLCKGYNDGAELERRAFQIVSAYWFSALSSMVECSITQSAALRMPSLRRMAGISDFSLISSSVFLARSARAARALSISSSVGTRFSCCAICSRAMCTRAVFSAEERTLAVKLSRVSWIWLR